ncbi:MAG TPA: O-antigen ligase family protein [Pyrinomonadaceae bacterium]|nr:O-antigen ligase family protein [Pyrinomonadaceae bacterium]
MQAENISRLDWILWISFLILVFSLALMQPFFYYGNLRFSSTDFIFPFVFILFIAAILFRSRRFQWHPVYWFLLFYFLCLVNSALFSINPFQSFVKLAGEFYLLSLTVITFNLVSTYDRLQLFLKTWLYGTTSAVFIGLISIFLFYFQRDNWLLNYTISIYGAVPAGNYPRLSSTFISASMFCNYLNVSLLFLFAAKHLGVIRKTFFYFLLFGLTITAIFTISSGLGGIVLAFSIWIWILLKDKNNRFARSSLFFGISLSAAFFFINFIALQPHSTAPYTLNLSGFTFYPSSRLMIWTEVSKTIANNFINGVGLGQDVCRVIYENTDGSKAYLTDAHNIFLSVFAQNGIFGLIAFLMLLIYLLKFSFSPINNGNKSASNIFYLIATAFLCSFVYQGLTGSFEDARHLWVLVGFVLSAKSVLQTT